MMKRIVSMMLSALLLLSPMAAFAEAPASNYYAGELTATAIGDSYYAGNQLNFDAALGLVLSEGVTDEALLAAAQLLSKAKVHLSFYDDFGTARIHGALTAGDATLLSADALVYEDGSVQIMSNLTGKLVLALPAGGLGAAMGSESMADYDFNDPASVEAFRALSPIKRLMMTSNDMVSLLINHLLGWVSYMQVDNDGELYQFDDTYLDATEDRDAVAQRMIGKIKADSFNTLLWNVATTVADTTGEFQLAIADLLADLGVTRYQARIFIDSLLTEETIDPATDYVQTSYYIVENKDESPIQYDDVSYFFKKLQKSTQRIWDNGTDNMMTMDVSYDDFGAMVGFDAHLAQFTPLLPFEGDFTYSIKTDDMWQRMHKTHGELQIYDDNRVVGDLDMQFGQDVDGQNHSHFVGQADVVNQKDGGSFGVGVNAQLDFAVAQADGVDSETFTASALLNGREGGEDSALLAATLSGMTAVDAERFDTNATAALSMANIGDLVLDMTLVQAEYEEIPFAGGQALDLLPMDEAKLDTIKDEIKLNAAKIAVGLVTKPDVLANLMTLFGKVAL